MSREHREEVANRGQNNETNEQMEDNEQSAVNGRILSGYSPLERQAIGYRKLYYGYILALGFSWVLQILCQQLGFLVLTPDPQIDFIIRLILTSTIILPWIVAALFYGKFKNIRGKIQENLKPTDVVLTTENGQILGTGRTFNVFDLLTILGSFEMGTRIRRLLTSGKGIILWIFLVGFTWMIFALEDLYGLPRNLSVLPFQIVYSTIMCLFCLSIPSPLPSTSSGNMLIGYLSTLEFYPVVWGYRVERDRKTSSINPFSSMERRILLGLRNYTYELFRELILAVDTIDVDRPYLALTLAIQTRRDEVLEKVQKILDDARTALMNNDPMKFFNILLKVKSEFEEFWEVCDKFRVSLPPLPKRVARVDYWKISLTILFGIVGILLTLFWL